MRQLVSVVTETSVAYYLTEGDSDEVQQVAQVLNTGLAVPDVVELGANLLDALRLNGHRKAGVAATAPTPALPPAPPRQTPAPARKVGRPRGPAKRPMRRWGFTKANVLADLRAHPGSTYAEAAERISGSPDAAAKGSYGATLSALERELIHRGATVQRQSFTAKGADGTMKSFVRLTLLEPEPRATDQ